MKIQQNQANYQNQNFKGYVYKYDPSLYNATGVGVNNIGGAIRNFLSFLNPKDVKEEAGFFSAKGLVPVMSGILEQWGVKFECKGVPDEEILASTLDELVVRHFYNGTQGSKIQ